MSYDVCVRKFAERYRLLDEIPEDAETLPLGTLDTIRERISAVFPSTEWQAPDFGVFEDERGSIEFELGEDYPADSITFYVRGTEAIVQPIVELCLANGWDADDGEEELLTVRSHREAGFLRWAKALDYVIGHYLDQSEVRPNGQ